MTRLTRTAALLTFAALAMGACSFQHTDVLGPAPTATTTPSAAAPYVGTWTSQSVTAPSPSSCSNFQWTVTNQTATSMAGTFTATCAGGITASGQASGELINPTTVPITVSGTAQVPGNANCAFSISGTGTVEDSGAALFVPYTGTTCLGPVHGTETLRKHSSAPPPPPPPPPPPAPPDPPVVSSGPSDAIDLSQATIMNSPADVASWPATATLTFLDLGVGGAHVEFTKRDGPGSWPDFLPPGWEGPLEYTLWIVLKINGHWYASGCMEFWRGLDRNGGGPAGYAQNWYYDPGRWGPMSGHQPAPGEQVGFLVTAGDARNNGGTILKERSNVVMVSFPNSGGESFSFSSIVRPLVVRR